MNKNNKTDTNDISPTSLIAEFISDTRYNDFSDTKIVSLKNLSNNQELDYKKVV